MFDKIFLKSFSLFLGQTSYTHISYSQAFISPGSVQQMMLRLYCGSLDTGGIVNLTAVKFELFIFPVLSFALPNITNIFIFMVLENFFLSPA